MIKRTIEETERTPAVSIIIAAYNSAGYISQALDSVQAQTFSDYEVIVVDDGSEDRDELERVLESHPLSIIYLTQENRGVSGARNSGIRIAKGTFYAQLDSDDQWTPDYLQVQLQFLTDNPDVALVYPNAVIIGDTYQAGSEFMKVSPSEGEVTFESLVRQQCTVMTSVTARMNAIKAAGMFDEDLRRCEDFDLWLRMVKNGGHITYHRQVLASYHRHKGSLSSDRIPMLRSVLTVFEKCFRTMSLTTAERQVLKEQADHNRAVLRLYEGKHALRAGGVSTALIHFERANEHLRSSKLVLVIFLLRHVPRLVIWTLGKRERLLLSQPDKAR
jgi:glycosyltransferase involved in cell wall biosynthesis